MKYSLKQRIRMIWDVWRNELIIMIVGVLVSIYYIGTSL